jgi:23S rRNA pseudouridine1911/1915/1917 synthase
MSSPDEPLKSEIDDEGAEHLEATVPALMDAMRIDRALAMLTGCSRSEAVRLIEGGSVVVDGVAVTKPSQLLSEGGVVEAVLPAPSDGSVTPDASVDVTIALLDDDVIVVNKPYSQVVHPGAGNHQGTMIAGVIARYPDVAKLAEEGVGEIGRPGIVHRLDKGTSGLLLIARNKDAFESLSAQIASRGVERRYIAVVEGHVESARGVVDAPIGRSATSPTKMTVRPDGREARTHYEVITYLEQPSRTIIGATLETGRTHQIRVHMAAIGHSVVNDPRYGQRNERSIDPERLALHAGRVAFDHPTSGERVVVTAEVPSDMIVLGPMKQANEWLSAN